MNTKCHFEAREEPSGTKLAGLLSPAERSFVCGMQTSKAFRLQHGSCSMLVRGRFQPWRQPPSSCSPCATDQPLFVALCTPTVNRLQGHAPHAPHACHSFSSVHRLDMSCTQASHRFAGVHINKFQDSILHSVTIFVLLFLPVFYTFWGIQMKKWKGSHGTAWCTPRTSAP